MHLRLLRGSFLLIAAAALAHGTALAQVRIYFKDYVGDPLKGPLNAMSENYNDANAGEALWVATDCGGKSMLRWRKGRGTYPWASEVHAYFNGYWQGLAENGYNPGTGAVTFYRVFRDNASGKKGVARFPQYTTGFDYHIVAPYTEESWNSCNGTSHTNANGSVHQMTDELGHDYVIDCRSRPCSASATPVSLWVHTEYWGSDNVEIYRFARWIDPVTGQNRGLGLFQWERWGSAFTNPPCTQMSHCVSTNRYVVTLPNTWIPCSTCPDP